MSNGSGPSAPFTLEDVRGRIAELDDADAYLEKAVKAGIDMSDQRKRSAEIRQQLIKMAQAFYPGQL